MNINLLNIIKKNLKMIKSSFTRHEKDIILINIIISIKERIPNNLLFWCLFVFSKFLGPFMNINHFSRIESSNNQIIKFLRNLIFFKSFDEENLSYDYYNIFILTIYLWLLAPIGLMYYVYQEKINLNQRADYIYKFDSRQKLLIKISSFLIVMILLFSQHIIEIMSISILHVYVKMANINLSNNNSNALNTISILNINNTKTVETLNDSDNENIFKSDTAYYNLLSFEENLQLSVYPIFALNLIFILISNIFIFYFIKYSNDISCLQSKLKIKNSNYLYLSLTLIGNLQALQYYNTIFDDKKTNINLTVLIITFLILVYPLLAFLGNLLYKSIIGRLMMYSVMNCFFMGITNVIFSDLENSYFFFLSKLFFTNTISFLIIHFYEKRTYVKITEKMNKSLFEDNKLINYNVLIHINELLSDDKRLLDNLFYFIEIIRNHQISCKKSRRCFCYKYEAFRKLEFMELNQQKDLINLKEEIIYFIEKELFGSLLQTNSESYSENKEFSLLHIDFVFNIKKSKMLAYYLIDVYSNGLNNFDNQNFFENLNINNDKNEFNNYMEISNNKLKAIGEQDIGDFYNNSRYAYQMQKSNSKSFHTYQDFFILLKLTEYKNKIKNSNNKSTKKSQNFTKAKKCIMNCLFLRDLNYMKFLLTKNFENFEKLYGLKQNILHSYLYESKLKKSDFGLQKYDIKKAKFDNKLYNFESILNLCKQLAVDYAKLKNYIKTKYAEKQLENPEIGFLVFNFYSLFNKKIPFSVRNLFKLIKNYENILFNYETVYREIEMKHPVIVKIDSSLNFNISYFSQKLCDMIYYKRQELIGQDLSILLPDIFKEVHAKILKKYIFVDDKYRFNSETFLVTKKKHYFAFNLKAVIFPSLDYNIKILMDINPIIKDESGILEEYVFILDKNMSNICFSQNFENNYYISMDFFDRLKVKFYDLFGINNNLLENNFESDIGLIEKNDYSIMTKNKNKNNISDISNITKSKEFEINIFSDKNVAKYQKNSTTLKYKPNSNKENREVNKNTNRKTYELKHNENLDNSGKMNKRSLEYLIKKEKIIQCLSKLKNLICEKDTEKDLLERVVYFEHKINNRTASADANLVNTQISFFSFTRNNTNNINTMNQLTSLKQINSVQQNKKDSKIDLFKITYNLFNLGNVPYYFLRVIDLDITGNLLFKNTLFSNYNIVVNNIPTNYSEYSFLNNSFAEIGSDINNNNDNKDSNNLNSNLKNMKFENPKPKSLFNDTSKNLPRKNSKLIKKIYSNEEKNSSMGSNNNKDCELNNNKFKNTNKKIVEVYNKISADDKNYFFNINESLTPMNNNINNNFNTNVNNNSNKISSSVSNLPHVLNNSNRSTLMNSSVNQLLLNKNNFDLNNKYLFQSLNSLRSNSRAYGLNANTNSSILSNRSIFQSQVQGKYRPLNAENVNCNSIEENGKKLNFYNLNNNIYTKLTKVCETEPNCNNFNKNNSQKYPSGKNKKNKLSNNTNYYNNTKHEKISNFIKYFFYLCLIITFCLLICDYPLKLTTMNFSQKLADVNYFILGIKSEVFFSALTIITACTNIDNIDPKQITGYENNIVKIKAKLEKSSANLNTFIYRFFSYLDDLDYKGLTDIFRTINNEEEFNFIYSDWNSYKRNSSFITQLKSFNYLSSQMTKNNHFKVCRIRERFYNRNFIYNSQDAEKMINRLFLTQAEITNILSLANKNSIEELGVSYEENILFYIVENVLSQFKKNILNLSLLSNQILQDYHKSAGIIIIAFNIFVFVFLLLYIFFSLFFLINKKNKLMKSFVKLFTNKHSDKFFEMKMLNLKNLLNSFDLEICLQFETKKNEILLMENKAKFTAEELAVKNSNLKQEKSSLLIKKRNPKINKKINKEKKLNHINDSLNANLEASAIRFNKDNSKTGFNNGTQPINEGMSIISFKKHSDNDGKELNNNDKEIIFSRVQSLTIYSDEFLDQIRFDHLDLKIYSYGKVIILLGGLAIVILSLINLIENSAKFEGFKMGNILAANFLERVPKFCELLLYSKISIMYNDIFYIPSISLVENPILNYYNVTIDLAKDGILNNLKNSHFVDLYYQFKVIDENIKNFMNNNNNNNNFNGNDRNILPNIRVLENQLNSKDLCYVLSKTYYDLGIMPQKSNFSEKDFTKYFQDLNSYVSECRFIGNGLNNNPLNIITESVLLTIKNNYYDFYNDKGKNITKFLGNNEIFRAILEIEYVFKEIHDSNIFLVKADIDKMYKETLNVEFNFFITNISVFIVLNFILIGFVMRKLNEFSRYLNYTLHRLDKAFIKKPEQL